MLGCLQHADCFTISQLAIKDSDLSCLHVSLHPGVQVSVVHLLVWCRATAMQ